MVISVCGPEHTVDVHGRNGSPCLNAGNTSILKPDKTSDVSHLEGELYIVALTLLSLHVV